MAEDEYITAVSLSPYGQSIAIGTSRGQVFQLNGSTGNVERRYQPHVKQVSDISIRDGLSIVTTSFDWTLYVCSLAPTKEERDKKSFKQRFKDLYEISCFQRVSSTRDSEFILGTGSGDVWYWRRGANQSLFSMGQQSD